MPLRSQIRILLLALALLISACGQKGPLFMPDDNRPENQSEAKD
ncbi:MAG: lipoprotein [Candidatus Thiodiazotropha sp.]